MIEDIDDQVQLLKDNPKLGRVAPVLNNDTVRELVAHKNYIMVYELTNGEIVILTIRHSKRDINRLNLL